jgi:hypothetical protein
MPVDIEQAGAVIGFVDQMVVPDFVVQRGRFGHERRAPLIFEVGSARTRASKEKRQRIKARA